MIYTPEFKDIYSIPVKGMNGEPMFLEQFRGKILVVVNTTGWCGYADQWPLLDAIQEEYKDKNVQIVYVPTNDFYGSVTYGEYKDGIKDAKDSQEYAAKKYGIDAPFTELLSSRNTPCHYNVDTYDSENLQWIPQPHLYETQTQAPRDHLYRFLIPEPTFEPMLANFQKYITNSQGMPVACFTASAFSDSPGVVKNTHGEVQSRPEEIENFKKILDEIIETDTCNTKPYMYKPYDPQYTSGGLY
jgi:glutathione peroxidase-family protein